LFVTLFVFWNLLEHNSIKTAEINEKSQFILQSLFHCDPLLRIYPVMVTLIQRFLLKIHPSTLKICGKITRLLVIYVIKTVIIYYTVLLAKDKHGGTDCSVACTAFYRYQLMLLTVSNINSGVNLFIHKYMSYAGVSSESVIATLKLIGNLFRLNEFWFAEWRKDKHLFIYLLFVKRWISVEQERESEGFPADAHKFIVASLHKSGIKIQWLKQRQQLYFRLTMRVRSDTRTKVHKRPTQQVNDPHGVDRIVADLERLPAM